MKAALFDLDGVLVDSEGIYTRIWEDIDRAYPTGVDGFALKIKGMTLEQILGTYYANGSVATSVREMLKKSEKMMEYRVFEGVEPFLTTLKKKRVPMAIVTSSNSAKMQALFSQLPWFGSYFDAVLTDADTTRSKPDPECYLNGARRLGVDIGDCVVFEDSFAGLESGRRAGAYVVALSTTNAAASLVDKADEVVGSLAELDVEKLFGV